MVLLDNVQIVSSTTGSFLYVCVPLKIVKKELEKILLIKLFKSKDSLNET
jgi:hypothetical protein